MKRFNYIGGGGTLEAQHKGFTLAEGATHVAMLADVRRHAFTLAEVLVTLGIIGVVSAMTVPSLMQNYQRQSYVTQLHKVYNELSQVLVRYQNDKNAVNLLEAGLTSTAAIQNMLTSYTKVIATCDTVTSPCFATSYKYQTGAAVGEGSYTANVKGYVLASGAAIRPSYSATTTKLANFMIDINGPKGPNIAGRDLFFIYLYKNGLLDDGTDQTVNQAPLTKEQREAAGTCQSSLTGCFGRLLNNNWEMTY